MDWETSDTSGHLDISCYPLSPAFLITMDVKPILPIDVAVHCHFRGPAYTVRSGLEEFNAKLPPLYFAVLDNNELRKICKSSFTTPNPRCFVAAIPWPKTWAFHGVCSSVLQFETGGETMLRSLSLCDLKLLNKLKSTTSSPRRSKQCNGGVPHRFTCIRAIESYTFLWSEILTWKFGNERKVWTKIQVESAGRHLYENFYACACYIGWQRKVVRGICRWVLLVLSGGQCAQDPTAVLHTTYEPASSSKEAFLSLDTT